MTNSAMLKEDNGKYAKLPVCPVCNKKVHIEEDDVNMEAWSFCGGENLGGEFMHNECATKEIPTESGEYWNGKEMVYIDR